MTVLLIGTLDTKGAEVAHMRARLIDHGLDVMVLDAGTTGPTNYEADVTRDRVLFRAGVVLEDLKDRGEAVAAAARGAALIAQELAESGRLHGVIALGGSAGTTIGTSAMRALPFGVPKVMVSTMASGQVRPYVEGSDIAMFASVADVSGLNRITRSVLANAAGALAGMVRARAMAGPDAPTNRPLVAATMFGVTTPCVQLARELLEAADHEVVVFHATGTGGQAMERLVREGQVAAVLDLTTTELADELVGGVLSAGPDRLRAAARRGVPQVVGLGALDMVNFGPRETVPERFSGRLFHVHNPNVTLMRTTPEENARLGAMIVEALAEAIAPTVVLVSRGGVSALDAPGRPFYDPVANEALFDALTQGLKARPNPWVTLSVREEHVNDPSFARAAVEALQGAMTTHSTNTAGATSDPAEGTNDR